MAPILALIFAIYALIGPVAWASPTSITPSGVELERLADESIVPPGVEGGFFLDLPPPVVCSGGALFQGVAGFGGTGVYLAPFPGALAVIANQSIPVPGSGRTFEEAGDPVCLGRQIVFLGDDDVTPSSTGRSVYSWTDGLIRPIIEQGTVIGSSTVRTFHQATANEFGVAVLGRLLHPSAADVIVVIPNGAAPTIIADDLTTVLPGQTEVASIYGAPLLVGSDLIFLARTQDDLGIYKWSEEEGVSLIVDTQTPAPVPGGGNFYNFDAQYATLDEGLVFGAVYDSGLGLFIWDGSNVRPLILPGEVGQDGETLTAVGLPNGAGSLLSFSARTSDNPFEAIYVRTGTDQVKRILGIQEDFEGGEIDIIRADANHNTVAIRLRTCIVTDCDDAIYRVAFVNPFDVPALSPAGIAALALLLTLAGLWSLRRQTGGISK